MSHIQRGEPVTAGVASRPDRTMEGRTNYLKEVIDTIEAGRALILRDQPVAADVLEQQVVYWNSGSQRYELALAAVENDDATGMYVAAESADAVGMVLAKKVGNTADIVIWGMVPFESLSNALTDDPIQPGRHYLSATVPGQLVKQRPPATVAVCLVLGPLDACDENTWVYVMPQIKDFLEDHIHYQFELEPAPAGETSPPSVGGQHVITSPDASLKGWLPASHASFNGNAPPGAAFGYNLEAHPELSKVFPPIPPTSSVVEMIHSSNLGSNETSFEGLERVPPEQVLVDKNGIWWMTDCYNEAPWPTSLDTAAAESSLSAESASSQSSATGCPTARAMRIILSFVKMTFLTDKTVVTSLQPDTGQPLRYINCNGEEANTGDLYSQLLLALLLEDEYYGGQALKGVTDENKFKRGWVAEGLIAGSDKVVLTSTHSRLLDPDADPHPDSNPTVHQELITVDVQIDPTERELPAQLVVLGDAVERVYKNVPYLGLPAGRDSGIRAKFVIPPAGLPLDPKLKVRVQLFGRGSGTLTDLDTSYYISERPAVGLPTPITEGDTALAMDTDLTVVVDEINEVESEEIAIAPGDTICVAIDRAASGTPAYDYEIGLFRVGAVIVPGS